MKFIRACYPIDTSTLSFVPSKPNGQDHFHVRNPLHDVAPFMLYLPREVADFDMLPSALGQSRIERIEEPQRLGMEASFFGNSEARSGANRAFLILNSGRVSSRTVKTPQAYGRFLNDSDVYPGNRGVPVLPTDCGRRPELVQVIVRRNAPREEQFSDRAAAVEAGLIRETLARVTDRDAKHITPSIRHHQNQLGGRLRSLNPIYDSFDCNVTQSVVKGTDDHASEVPGEAGIK